MATAFTLTLAHLGERFVAGGAAAASAAYITGNVASNLFGRMVSAAVADHLGLEWTFYVFAGLNVAGAFLAAYSIGMTMRSVAPPAPTPPTTAPIGADRMRYGDQRLIAAYGIGFCILFAFIGTFTYVNFVLTRPPLSIGQMQLGFAYLVFLDQHDVVDDLAARPGDGLVASTHRGASPAGGASCTGAAFVVCAR